MFNSLKNFDPLIFLEVDTSSMMSRTEINALRNSLNQRMGEYIIPKLFGDLTKEQVDELMSSKSGEEAMRMIGEVPGIEKRIMEEMENFKKEFQKEIQEKN